MADLTATQQLTATISPKDRRGHPAALDGVPVWAGSDDTVITVEAAADGLSALVKAQAPGTARVSVTGDADLGAGVQPLIGTLDVNVTPGIATVLDITAGPAEEQP